jgi:hypothetical protein
MMADRDGAREYVVNSRLSGALAGIAGWSAWLCIVPFVAAPCRTPPGLRR